eukprot:1146608-Pelagomonas_calceolata.AAC.8
MPRDGMMPHNMADRAQSTPCFTIHLQTTSCHEQHPLIICASCPAGGIGAPPPLHVRVPHSLGPAHVPVLPLTQSPGAGSGPQSADESGGILASQESPLLVAACSLLWISSLSVSQQVRVSPSRSLVTFCTYWTVHHAACPGSVSKRQWQALLCLEISLHCASGRPCSVRRSVSKRQWQALLCKEISLQAPVAGLAL